MKKSLQQLLLIALLLVGGSVYGQDPNFYIFLCFGQSNMEGYPGIPDEDKVSVDPRFQVLAAVDFPELKREQGNWYPAVPPLSRPFAGLSPADYFGRTLVANLPANIRVGVVNVAVGGCKIELFEKDGCASYVATAPEWMKPALAAYGENPYQRLVEMGKRAQKAGVIKGILLHQGESNSGEADWPAKVKGVYENLLRDLNLKASDVPLIAGEVVAADQGGKCAGMNPIIAKLPETIPTAHVVSSAGCPCHADHLHFTPAGYRELGRRYAETMLPLLGFPVAGVATPAARRPSGIEIVEELSRPESAHAPAEQDLAGYLMVYFKDRTQSAYLAVSRDGYVFTDVNGGDPVFDGAVLAEQHGVRDPHITRGPDGAFYLAMTDLHIFGQRAGFRDTEWQRPQEKYGWGNNRALVLMKSWDLIHWTHAIFRVDLAFPELGDIDCSWAPETTYDPVAGKMVVYFTIRYGNKNANIYWSYANEAFTKLETTPTLIPGIGGIDADLTLVGGQWRMFYVADAKIRHATSARIADGYTAFPQRIDPNSVSTEAPNLFKRLGTSTYVLMYDVYGARPNNMGFSETEDFVTWRHLGGFNEGVMKGTNFERPKHGAVTSLTLDELRTVAAHWKLDLKLE